MNGNLDVGSEFDKGVKSGVLGIKARTFPVLTNSTKILAIYLEISTSLLEGLIIFQLYSGRKAYKTSDPCGETKKMF